MIDKGADVMYAERWRRDAGQGTQGAGHRQRDRHAGQVTPDTRRCRPNRVAGAHAKEIVDGRVHRGWTIPANLKELECD